MILKTKRKTPFSNYDGSLFLMGKIKNVYKSIDGLKTDENYERKRKWQ